MPLRFQLLFLSLLTLLLPWAGCRYAREMESVLRDGEQQALLATATTLASVVAAEPELMYPTAQSRALFDPAAGDLYVYPLRTPPLLDGYADEWGLPDEAFGKVRSKNGQLQARYVAGADENNFYLLIAIKDGRVTLEQTDDARLEPELRGDHVWLAMQTPPGETRQYLFATAAPGLISARRPVVSEYGERGERIEPRMQAYWQPDTEGYRLEIRVPLSLAGELTGFEAVDVGDLKAGDSIPIRAGTLDAAARNPLGRLMLPSGELQRRLAELLPATTHVVVSDPRGWVIAESGALQRSAGPYDALESSDWLQSLYRRLLESGRAAPPARPSLPGRIAGPHAQAALAGREGAAWFGLRDERSSVLAVAAPIRTGTERLGAIVLEQTGERLLILRDRALTRLLNLTLLASGGAVLATLIFATVLALRLGRLKRAAETALTHDGRLNAAIPGTAARDELGDLARSFDTLLKRLQDYTNYLRTLAGKLSHELRTPLAIVRSSLENLESEQTGGSSNVYLSRAQEGTGRLQTIVAAMGAATRTEEAIRQAERVEFDLAALVASATQAYAATFKDRRFEVQLATQPCRFYGAPDLIVQLLDKLIDNAVDFSAPHSPIVIQLQTSDAHALSVTNDGPPIPENFLKNLFEPLFEFRRHDTAEKPHFGLGLYIVRLIAEFHGGEMSAENLSSGSGVRIAVRLPLQAPTAV